MTKLDKDWMTLPDGSKIPRPKQTIQLPANPTNNDSPDHEFVKSNYYRGDNAPLCGVCMKPESQHPDGVALDKSEASDGIEVITRYARGRQTYSVDHGNSYYPTLKEALDALSADLHTPPRRRSMEQEFTQSIVIGDMRPLGFGEATDDVHEQGAVANASPVDSKLQQGPESTKLDDLLATALTKAYTRGKTATERERIYAVTAEEREEAKAKLLEWSRQEAVKARTEHLSDLARAVGILEGLGHPDKVLTDRYNKLRASIPTGENK